LDTIKLKPGGGEVWEGLRPGHRQRLSNLCLRHVTIWVWAARQPTGKKNWKSATRKKRTAT